MGRPNWKVERWLLFKWSSLDTMGWNSFYQKIRLKQTIWLWNHKSYRKFDFNESVANVLHDYMGMIIFDLWCCEAKNIISWRTLCHSNSLFGSSLQRQFCLPKIYQERRSVMTFSLHSASISQIIEQSLQGLISSE